MADETNPESPPAPRGTDLRTFLIADIRGYTRYTQEHGDDAASALARRFAEVVRTVVPDFDGELLELRGDEALCVFASARQALRTSIELQRRLRVDVDGEAPFPLGVGMGLDAGEAVPTDGGYRGKALNLAARLCSLAAPGQILATDGVVHLAHRVEGLRFLRRRPTRVKGVEEAVRFFEVLPVEDFPPLPGPSRRPPGNKRRLAVAASVVVLVGAIAALGLTGVFTSGDKRSSVHRLPYAGLIRIGLNDRVDQVIPLKRTPGVSALAVGYGSVWISTDQGVESLNTSTGQLKPVVLGDIAAPIALGGRSVFIYGGEPGNLRNYANVYNPLNLNNSTTGGSIAVIELQPFNHLQAPGPLAFGLGSLWAWEYGEAGCCTGKTLWQVDPTTHKVIARWAGPTDAGGTPGLTQGVAVGPEGAWGIHQGILTRLVPADGPLPPRVEAEEVAVGGGMVWAVSPTSMLIELNPSTGTIAWTHQFHEIDRIAVSQSSVWLEDQTDRTIVRIDIETHHRSDPVRLAITPGPIAVGPTGLWVGFPLGAFPL